MTSVRRPWTAGQLREELAAYPDDTPLRVAVTDPERPDEGANWDHVVLGAARGQQRHDEGRVEATPFLIIESHPLPADAMEDEEERCGATFREDPMPDAVYCGERGYHTRHTSGGGSEYYAWLDGDEGAGRDPIQ